MEKEEKKLTSFEDLRGHYLQDILVADDQETMTFVLDTGEQYQLYHLQNCCEHVTVEEIIGDKSDIVDEEILLAEEVSQINDDGTEEWTFYKLGTRKGGMTIRWYGESNSRYAMDIEWRAIE